VTSTIAEIVLALSIPCSIAVFFFMRPVPAALLVAIASEMFLPEGAHYKWPYLPAFDKHNLPYLCIFLACLVRCPGRVTKLPKEKWILALALCLLVGSLLTATTNGEAMVIGTWVQTVMPGLNFKDGAFMAATNFVESCLPFYLGYALIREQDDLETLLSALALGGLVYIPFALVELRLSPQWHRWIYGYAQSNFDQTIRWGGYRPMIFMPHGLALARFFLAATFALVVLDRLRRRLVSLPTRLLAWLQFLVLVACKSTGAIIFALAGLPLLIFSRPKRQLRVAVVLAWIAALYPVLRLSGIFPVDRLLEAAGGALPSERTGSLAFRFLNEDALLQHTRARIAFGWGEYGRNLVYDADGQGQSVVDGYWIIRLSENGIVGFLATFGPLVIPVLLANRRILRMSSKRDQLGVAGLAFILTLVTLDLIPNGLWACYPFLLAGALTRRLREIRREEYDLAAESLSLA
jgi:hypothetical protein